MNNNNHSILNEQQSSRLTRCFFVNHFLLNRVFVISINILLLIFLVVMNTQQEISAAKEYVQGNLNQIKKSIISLAYRNERYARTFSKQINTLHPLQTSPLVEVHYYPELNEFGFNRNVYPSNLLNGSLIGTGKPSDEIKMETNIFPFLDDLWSQQHQHSIKYNYYYISHTLKYFYLSTKYPVSEFNTRKHFFSTVLYNNYRSDINKQYQNKKGFYFTAPYTDYITHEQVITLKSPVYKEQKVIGDIGVDIPIASLSNAITLPRNFKPYLTFIFYNKEDGSKINIQKGNKNKFLPHIEMKVNIDDNNAIYANLSILFFLSAVLQNIVIGVLFLFLLNYMYSQLKKYKFQKNHFQLEAFTDSLTGLFNRRIMEKILPKLIREYQDKTTPISIIAIDANDFKIINDTYGHETGDKALMHIANNISHLSRKSDIGLRLGGDEFCIVLPDCPLDKATKMAHRLSIAINQSRFCEHNVHTGITTGCIEITKNESLKEALKRADNILYQNKKNKKITEQFKKYQ
ncbi:sensor domain-containing diguanylate cyclase [Photobacterium sp. CAIM 1938]|uniref:sensor domain-containing diguanylate cyclase n=3 Tax=Photobacterium lucens TaxID=2562949 RepID=UPI00136C1546|nr:sensor domain-containing diguanylate cyclase [Photobacterium lucens]MBP2698995.1 diguanylate cyclase [Vibrio parahaemolyticus]MZG80253.1 sensor domain-containing diguanylate cyclase [Photobacterium lucens]